MSLTQPESMVWAAAFAAALDGGFGSTEAAHRAHRAVHLLRTFRIRDRREEPASAMLQDYRGTRSPEVDGTHPTHRMTLDEDTTYCLACGVGPHDPGAGAPCTKQGRNKKLG